MPYRALVFSLILALCVQAPSLHAEHTSTRVRTLKRFKQQCDGGIGKSCYDYARMLWQKGISADRKKAKVYLLRGCSIGYKLACSAHSDHVTSTKHFHKSGTGSQGEGSAGACFTNSDLGNARMTPNQISATVVRGQRITEIKSSSFWARAGLSDGDVIYRVNNLPFNNPKEVLQVFANSGKKFGFEVEHGGLAITLWYTCL